MTPELWDRLKPFFEAAVETEPADRQAFLASLDVEEEIRMELRELVKAFETNGSTCNSLPAGFQELFPAALSSLKSGDVVGGRFRIVRWLGHGGMGDVYEALDLELSQAIALKTIRAEISGNEEILSRFKREVQIARRLSGQHICRIHELHVVGREGTTSVGAFLTMEFLDGITLTEKLERSGPIVCREALAIAIDLCAALATIHEAGIIHRDLKCRNIMLTERNGSKRAVLMDFGLARELAPQTATADIGLTGSGVTLGTPEYMAPEQFEGKEASPATDIYAMGVVLYELITGKHPFASSTSLGTAILRARRLEPASSIQNGVPHQWDLVIAKCLEYDPKLRFQSANELAEALQVMAGDKAGFRKWVILGATTVIALVAFSIRYLRLPLAPPRISEYFQVTRDGDRKSPIGTDGNRLYLNLLYPQGIGQVSISGGQIAQIPIDLPKSEVPHVWLRDVSPDGSSLLVWNPLEGLFVASILGHPVRHLANGFQAAWSPDGKWVAYSTDHGEIYLIRSEGGEPHLLVSSSSPVPEYKIITDLSWSPDGVSIRFTRDQELWQVTSTGSNLHLLLPKWNPSSWKCCGVWTPNGKLFLFVSGELNSSPFLPGAQLWAIEERSGQAPKAEPIQLTFGPIRWGKPIPARDGRRIFARGVTLRGELVRYDRRSEQLRPYLGGISAEFVTYSSGGELMAYVSFPDGVLWRANRDGTGVVQLTEPPFYPKFPRWSPDGMQILFTDSGPNRQDVLYVISAHGGTPKRILPEDNGPQSDGNWSPDGKKVLYQPCNFSRSSGAQGKAEFRILDLASRTITTVPGSEGMYWPRWSPDGRSIAGVTRNTYYLRVFDLKSRQWKTLENAWSDSPTWGQDSKYIYFILWLDNPGVFRIPASGGNAERIIDLKDFRDTGWFEDWMGLDPTDTPILLKDKGSDDIYALTLERK
jgi:serine/threonine protein kinase